MRILVLATILLASSSLYPSFAQDEGKAPAAAPQTVPAQTNQNSPPQQDQRNGGDQPRTDNREMGCDWRMHPGDGDHMGHDDRMGRDDRGMGRDWRMHRVREAGRDRDKDRERYGERGGRDWDRADRDRDNRGYYDQDRPRRRVKICVEYENGDEYCRYRE
jgi:hypothetical protein